MTEAEELMTAMARESWNDSVDRLKSMLAERAKLEAQLAKTTANAEDKS